MKLFLLMRQIRNFLIDNLIGIAKTQLKGFNINMWCILPKEELNNFLYKYPKLQDYNNEFLLNETDKYFILPRYFINDFPFDKMFVHEDNTFNGETIDIEFTATLRDYQEEGTNVIKNMWNNHGEINGLFKAKPGHGKTVIGAWITCLTKQKTLIILDNTILVEQWRNAYLNFTNLTEDDIGIFQGQVTEIDRPVVITMVQTLLAKQKSDLKEWYNKIKQAGFNLVFFDEVHATASGPKFALASLFINTRNVLGFSATPWSQGINKILLKNCIGEIIYSSKDYDTVPSINFVKFKSLLEKKYIYRFNIMNKDYVKGIAFYNSIIYNDAEYLNTIFKISKKLIDKGHALLIIVSTIKQVATIVEFLKLQGLSPIPFYSGERELNRDVDRLLVGTSKYISKGFDYDELSALLYGTPLKGRVSLVQTAGRILRSKQGKIAPEIYDLVDTNFGNAFTSTIVTKKNVFKEEFGNDIIFNEF
ncbi:MAG: DEAD/DEAH box helicase family protein [Magnetococcus sp. YQC-3]